MRWYELAPEAVLGVGLLVFLVDETDAATSAFKSGRAVALMAGAAIGWLVVRVVLARVLRRPAARAAVLLPASLAILAVVVLPAYHDERVVETLKAAAGPGVPATTPAPAEPVRLRSGSFRGIDHRAAGMVNIYRHPDGRHVVGLEDFDIQPGPDYDLYLVPGPHRTDRSGGVRLDDLRGNQGTQFYDTPTDLELGDGPWTVLVWCQTFGVPVAHATPA